MPGAGVGGGGDERRIFQKCAMHQLADFQFDHLPCDLIDEVAFGQGDDAVTQAEQTEDFQMFTRLRHDGIVGGHDEDGKIDARGAGEHVLDEAFVAGHIDNAEVKWRQIELAKPMSMVMPRAFSSGRRSQSIPVSALTRDVLP